jgi:3-methyladenine DNA glycosylase AlkD
MPATQSILDILKTKGSEKTRATYARHGLTADRVLGASMADLKTVAKTIKGQQALAMELYETGIVDAMYLAGMVADGRRMGREQLQAWAEGAAGMAMIAEYTVPWVTVENADGRGLAVEWVKSPREHIASSGWCTYTGLVTTKPDSSLDLKEIEGLLELTVKGMRGAQNRVRYTMNGFVIAVGSHVTPLLGRAKETAWQLGKVEVDMGDTACKVPSAIGCIEKHEAAGQLGWKRRTIRC